MKKTMLTALVFLFACSQGFASPDRVNKADAGIQLGGMFQQDDDISDGFFIGGSIAYGVHKNIAIGISTGWSGSDLEVQRDGNTLDGGNVSLVPIFGEVIFRAPNNFAGKLRKSKRRTPRSNGFARPSKAQGIAPDALSKPFFRH